MESFLFYVSMIVAIFAGYQLVRYLGGKRKVGELLIPTLTGLKYSPAYVQLALFAIALVITAVNAKTYFSNTQNLITGICLLGGFALYILHTIICALMKKGLYTQAVCCVDGIARYDEIQKYEIVPQNKKDYSMITFYCKGLIFSREYYTYIANDQIPEFKAALKKLR